MPDSSSRYGHSGFGITYQLTPLSTIWGYITQLRPSPCLLNSPVPRVIPTYGIFCAPRHALSQPVSHHSGVIFESTMQILVSVIWECGYHPKALVFHCEVKYFYCQALTHCSHLIFYFVSFPFRAHTTGRPWGKGC